MDMQPIVTLKDVWDRLEQVNKGVAQIQSDTRVLTEQMRAVSEHTNDHEQRLRDTERICEVVKDIPSRVTSLEKKVWALPGASTIIAAISLIIVIWKSFH